MKPHWYSFLQTFLHGFLHSFLLHIGTTCCLVCSLTAAQAQSFAGVWDDAKALESCFGGRFYESISIDTTDGANRQTHIDSCVAHNYNGKVKFTSADVYTTVLGRYKFVNDRKQYLLLITGTSDAYLCGTCGVALSGALWQQNGNTWQVIFKENDFAVRGADGIAPQVAFAEIGDDNQIGIFVWQRLIRDSLYHFYYTDIFTPLHRQFVQITGGNLQNDNRLPNICNAVSGNGDLPFNYETGYEFANDTKKEMYDLTTRRQGTQVMHGQIVPLDRQYKYRWANVNYVLTDSTDIKIYLPHRAQANENLRTIAAHYGTTLEEVRNDNPQLLTRPTLTLQAGEIIYICTHNRDTVANTAPSIESIEQAVGKPEEVVNIAPNVPNLSPEEALPDPKKTPKTAAKDNKDAPASTALRTHTVAAGETLFAISRKYNIQISDIQAFNDLPDNAVLKKGQVLRLEDPTNTAKRPTLADAYGKSTQIIDQTTPPTPPTNTDTPPSTPPKIHTVQKGETLYGIAQKYNVAIGRLQLLNHLKSYTVVLGQKIVLP